MQIEVRNQLLALNRQFYEDQGASFSRSRYQIQPGVRRLLPRLIESNAILDLGCGNGNLALALNKAGFKGQYLGLDQSYALLEHAQKAGLDPRRYGFEYFDLASWLLEGEIPQLADKYWPTLTCFATLHHLPSQVLQAAFFTAVASMMPPGAQLLLSVWQPSRSPRLKTRVQDWGMAGLSGHELEPGDLLLDWRANVSGQPALRYVHEFRPEILKNLGLAAGLVLEESFDSDGSNGQLGHYQIWRS